MKEGDPILAALPPGEIARRLRREGIACIRGEDGGLRRFTVTVCGLEATDVRRVFPNPVGLRAAGASEPDDRLRKIVSRAAVRALYVLGLDSGQATVAADGEGKPQIAGLSGTMRPSPGEGERRTAAAAKARETILAKEKENGVRVMLGADPEFVLLAPDGKVVPASRYLPPYGAAGSDSVVRRGVRLWPLAELRPEPSEEPPEVVRSIRRLLAEASRRIGHGPIPAWRAGAWPVRGLPLGGHIHLSGAALTGERLRALDNAVALPLRLLEPPGAAARRPRYGALGDFRMQPHGGFEYRTPPSWLVSRKLALGVLALAKIAAEHASELAEARPLDDDRLRDAFYGSGDEEALREEALRYFENIRRTEGYRKYSECADFVFRAVRQRRRWDESGDFRLRWGIPVS